MAGVIKRISRGSIKSVKGFSILFRFSLHSSFFLLHTCEDYIREDLLPGTAAQILTCVVHIHEIRSTWWIQTCLGLDIRADAFVQMVTRRRWENSTSPAACRQIFPCSLRTPSSPVAFSLCHLRPSRCDILAYFASSWLKCWLFAG